MNSTAREYFDAVVGIVVISSILFLVMSL